ncbi:cerebellar degeneration-related protein 2-like [Drosophila kikkawai]|uniref:Cerebellar degeneration-related protein 2-like n=1 Tax=Drosophila kikkawai TaxID=30033 RepID=A0ABM3C511_DROKI|nr:cerebellar degeneration-related protein 2-like [Drosophila kikkawai]
MEALESSVSKFRLNDLQLAAELEKTLLERNNELDTQMKLYKAKAKEQEREIVHLRKHINALAEENDTRVKVLEQVDAGIQELERVNQRLTVEKSRAKKQNQLLTTNAEVLEARCEDLTLQLSLARQSLSKVERHRQERHTKLTISNNQEMVYHQFQAKVPAENHSLCHANSVKENFLNSEDRKELDRLLREMETTKQDFLAEQQRCADLEEQLGAIIQENQSLQGRLAEASGSHETMSLQGELSLLDEVVQGQLCTRCLRFIKQDLDEQSIPASSEVISRSGSTSQDRFLKTANDLQLNANESLNPYHEVVEKFEALLEVQRTSSASRNLAEAKKTSDWDASPGLKHKKKESRSKEFVVKLNIAPIELWETESSSSGVSYGTDSKYSQTNESQFRKHPGEHWKLYQEQKSDDKPGLIQGSAIIAKSLKKESPKVVSSARKPLQPPTTASKPSAVCEPSPIKSIVENGRLRKPLQRKPQEYQTIAAGVKKKNRRQHRHQSYDNVTRKRQPTSEQRNPDLMAQGSISKVLNISRGCVNAPLTSDTSLKKCGLSYAEVLRQANKSGN